MVKSIRRAVQQPVPNFDVPLALRDAIFKRDNYACVYCLRVRNVSLTVEHVTPRKLFHHSATAAEVNAPTNLATACDSCNNAKSVYNLEQFAEALIIWGADKQDVKDMVKRVTKALRTELDDE